MTRLRNLLIAHGDITETGLFLVGMAMVGLVLVALGAGR